MFTGLRGRRATLSIALALIVALVGGQTAFGALTWQESNVTHRPDGQGWPAIWGDTIVYEDYATADGMADIVMYDLVTGKETTIAAFPDNQYNPEIYGDQIVWQDARGSVVDYDVYRYDISKAAETLVASGPERQYLPRIHGTRIIWSDSREATANGTDIYMHDMVSGAQTRIAGDPGDQDYAAIWGQRVVYEDYNTPSENADVRLLDLITGSTVKVTDEVADPAYATSDYDPRVWFNVVAWGHEATPTSQYDVFAYNTDTKATRTIASGPTDQDLPHVWGNLITWVGDANETTTVPDIFAYSLTTDESATVVAAPNRQSNVMHWGNKVVWMDSRDEPEADIWIGVAPLKGERAAGLTRYQTAVEASKSHYSSAETVVLATGADFADALAASGLAGCVQGPLLLTTPNALHADAAAEITRLGAKKVVIVGGTGAVSGAVSNALSVGMGLNVRRIGGIDRYETSALIAKDMATTMGTRFDRTAFLARGDVFADALAVSPLSYYNRFPILLTRTSAMPTATIDAVKTLDIEAGVVAGGSGAVAENVQDAFDALLVAQGGKASERWAGVDRYETAEMVAGASTERNWAGRGFVGLAVGDNFPDALAGGVAAGQEFGIILLTRTSTLSTPAKNILSNSGKGIGWLQAFGGTGVITDAVIAEAVDAAQ